MANDNKGPSESFMVLLSVAISTGTIGMATFTMVEGWVGDVAGIVLPSLSVILLAVAAFQERRGSGASKDE